MPGRSFTAQTEYRYGFNGKEKDKETEAGLQDYGERFYDTKIGRLLSVDPLNEKFPELSTFQFAANRPIDGIDILGLQWYKAVGDWFYNQTAFGLLTNTGKAAKAVLKGDKRAALSLISYGATKYLEGKEAFGANGTRNQKEEFVTSLLLDAATVYAAPKLSNGKARGSTLATEEGATSSKSTTSTSVSKQVSAANGGSSASVADQSGLVPLLDKIGKRKLYAENTFTSAGKEPKDVLNLMKTVDFKRAVSEKILDIGDKVYRFERINSKGGDMHFFTDAHGADAGPTGVGFASPEGYKLVTYEVTQKTNVMQSTIKNTNNKQYFSTELQKNIKKVGEE